MFVDALFPMTLIASCGSVQGTLRDSRFNCRVFSPLEAVRRLCARAEQSPVRSVSHGATIEDIDSITASMIELYKWHVEFSINDGSLFVTIIIRYQLPLLLRLPDFVGRPSLIVV